MVDAAGGGRPVIGVLALQGGVREHAELVRVAGGVPRPVRSAAALCDREVPLDALILPGGESSTIDRLLRRFGLAEPLTREIDRGLPVLGTCAGLILLAREVLDPAPGQRSLAALDVAVRRNAFGPQLASTGARFELHPCRAGGVDRKRPPVTVAGALIRAPEITAVGSGARVLATRDGRVLGATSLGRTAATATAAAHGSGDALGLGQVTGVAFHPELMGDATLHRSFVARARRYARERPGSGESGPCSPR